MPKSIVISVTNDIGYDQRMLKTASSLISNSYNVKIIGRHKYNSKEYPELPYGVSAYRFSLFFNKGKLFYIEYHIRLLFHLLFKVNADIFCAVDLDTIIPNLIVSKLRGKPLIYDAHEYFTEVPELQGRWLEKKLWKWVEKCSVPYCNAVYTVSESIANILENEYGKKVETIHNLPNQYERDRQLKKENVILYQGDLNEGRGLELAIKSMDAIEGYILWIAGDGYLRQNLDFLVQELTYPERIVFLGKLAPKELRTYTQRAKFGLNLLENKGLNYFYSLANKFFDFIQAGVVPITMNFPEYQRIQERYNCSILINTLDEDEYLTAIKEVISTENKYNDLLKNCDIAGSFLTWENQEEKLSSIYKNV
jgi:glycosyltransferase involved in cell wall biosynthesis